MLWQTQHRKKVGIERLLAHNKGYTALVEIKSIRFFFRKTRQVFQKELGEASSFQVIVSDIGLAGVNRPQRADY